MSASDPCCASRVIDSTRLPHGWSGRNFRQPNDHSSFVDLFYYHADRLGSTGYVTDAQGKLTEHIEYFPFGETWVQQSVNSDPTKNTPYLFTGKELDQDTGYYYYGARYYDPRISVWQSNDPAFSMRLGESSFALNPYQYGLQNPLRYNDPTGKGENDKNNNNQSVSYWLLSHSVFPVIYWWNEGKRGTAYNQIHNKSTGDEQLDEAIYDAREVCLQRGERIANSLAKEGTQGTETVATVAMLVSGIGDIYKAVQGATEIVKMGQLKNVVGDLIEAGEAPDREGLTRVGRALQKHTNRPGAVFPKISGTTADINEQGAQILNEILSNPNSTAKPTTTGRYAGKAFDVFDPNTGRGARWSKTGEFIGFLEK